MKRTLLSHLQMLSIAMSLSVPWPDAIRTLLAFVSSLTSISSHASTIQCTSLNTNLSHAQVYYGMLILSATLPLGIMGITYLHWHVCAPRSKIFSCGSSLVSASLCPKNNPFINVKHGSHLSINVHGKVQRSTRDGWIVTNVLLLYIFIPSVVKSSLQMCQWEMICGVHYWALDDTVEYYSQSHQFIIMAVAVPSILFYGVILVMLAMVYIGLHTDRQTNKKLMFRFGLLFSGFAPHYWWYEIILFLRKIGVIFIVTFASSNEQQLHIVMGLLIVLLFLQEHMRPFDNPQASAKAQVQNQRLHRIESFSLLVLITMIWCAVFFVLGCDDQARLCSVLGISVLSINVVFVGVLGFIFAQAWSKKNQLKEKLTSLSTVFKHTSTKREDVTVVESHSVLNPTDGETKMKGNPMLSNGSKSDFVKERRHSKVARVVEMTATRTAVVVTKSLNEIKIGGNVEEENDGEIQILYL